MAHIQELASHPFIVNPILRPGFRRAPAISGPNTSRLVQASMSAKLLYRQSRT